jgi:ribosomal protein S18 acetylase RimI-like enzyme
MWGQPPRLPALSAAAGSAQRSEARSRLDFARKFRIAYPPNAKLLCRRNRGITPIKKKGRLRFGTMHPLDNVVWTALTTRQANLAESFDQARRFAPEISAIGGFLEPTSRGYESLAGLLSPGKTVNLALDVPYQPRPGWNLILGTPMPQMVYEGNGGSLAPQSVSDQEIVTLGPADVQEMMELTSLTKPGPFSKRTHEMGAYLGIRSHGKLIAMAGERMKVPGHTEVSAVCTHPEHTGHGYARILMTEVMQRIRGRGETPFLHVREDNVRAIELYQRLGFARRVLLHLAVLRKV